ncbi:uncharacterized protein LOC111412329 isoform X1 [Olea europaea var. sylvestris]|uniref:uncharacterized protein LOC111412329 isoform X1 n=1 Tax=Olea europaea var. sylvestris TaxID=158386 RepID=UPI000C1D4AAA|nr:uncharacterized protein LOC111412329 isoform X1 [Olea europaea var. sylvestris]
MANFCCSIETEPRTLNQGQLHHAREVAIDIVQKKEADEASSIFIDGLKPVVAIKEMEVVISDANSIHKMDVSKEHTQILETSCQCSSAAIMDSPDQSRVKEPLSSPF